VPGLWPNLCLAGVRPTRAGPGRRREPGGLVRLPVTSRFDRGSHRTMSKRSRRGFRYADAARRPCCRPARASTGREVTSVPALIIDIYNDLGVKGLSDVPASTGAGPARNGPRRGRSARNGPRCGRSARNGPGAVDLPQRTWGGGSECSRGGCRRVRASRGAGAGPGAAGGQRCGCTGRRGHIPAWRQTRTAFRPGRTCRRTPSGTTDLPPGQAFMDMTCTSAFGNMTSASANGLQRNGISAQGRTQRVRERGWPPNTIRSRVQTRGERRHVCQLTLASFLLFK
jgi:hypothetical protein